MSLDDINASSQEELTRLGFLNINTTLANTVEALEITHSKRLIRPEVKLLIKNENFKLCKIMPDKKENTYRKTTMYTDKSMKFIAAQLTICKKQLLTIVGYIESVAKDRKAHLMKATWTCQTS